MPPQQQRSSSCLLPRPPPRWEQRCGSGRSSHRGFHSDARSSAGAADVGGRTAFWAAAALAAAGTGTLVLSTADCERLDLPVGRAPECGATAPAAPAAVVVEGSEDVYVAVVAPWWWIILAGSIDFWWLTLLGQGVLQLVRSLTGGGQHLVSAPLLRVLTNVLTHTACLLLTDGQTMGNALLGLHLRRRDGAQLDTPTALLVTIVTHSLDSLWYYLPLLSAEERRCHALLPNWVHIPGYTAKTVVVVYERRREE